jgi:hypothetical protein
MTVPSRFATKLTAGVFEHQVAGLRLPDREYLVGEFVLGGTEAASVKNHADPSNPLTVQGSPVYNANSVTVRSHVSVGFGFLTGIVPHEGHTLIVVRKNATQATTVKVVGMGVGTLFGARQFGADNYFSMGETANNEGARRPRPASASEVYFECGIHSPVNPQRVTGGYASMYWYTSGNVRQTALSATQALANRTMYQEYFIGSTGLTDSVTTNNLEVFFVAIYNKALTLAGIDATHDAIVAYYAARGVTVI